MIQPGKSFLKFDCLSNTAFMKYFLNTMFDQQISKGRLRKVGEYSGRNVTLQLTAIKMRTTEKSQYCTSSLISKILTDNTFLYWIQSTQKRNLLRVYLLILIYHYENIHFYSFYLILQSTTHFTLFSLRNERKETE